MMVVTIVTVAGCALLGLAGAALAAMGLYALFVGIHGGPIVAVVMLAAGVAVCLAAHRLLTMYLRSERERG